MNIPDLHQCNQRESNPERAGQAPGGSHSRVGSHSISTHKVPWSFDTAGETSRKIHGQLILPLPPSDTVVRERVISLHIVTLSVEQQKKEIRESGGRIETAVPRSMAGLLGH